MKSVILAAGRGTRLPEITKDKPKCLIEIAGTTILERQISILLKYKIEKIVIVIGYKADTIKKKIKSTEKIEFIINEDYNHTDNIYSLYLTSNILKGHEFILINGDAIFDEEIIKKLVKERGNDIAPIDRNYYDHEELKIRGKNGRAIEILPKTALENISDGSTIGMFKFSSEGSRFLFNEIETCIKQNIKNKWFEYALNNVLKKINMNILDIHEYKWIEVDTIEDIKKARILFG